MGNASFEQFLQATVSVQPVARLFKIDKDGHLKSLKVGAYLKKAGTAQRQSGKESYILILDRISGCHCIALVSSGGDIDSTKTLNALARL